MSTWEKLIGSSLYTEETLKGKATRLFSFPLETFSQSDPFLPVLFILPELGQEADPHTHTAFIGITVAKFLLLLSFFPSFHFCCEESPTFQPSWWFSSQATQLAKPWVPRPPQNIKMPGNLKEVSLMTSAVEALFSLDGFILILFSSQAVALGISARTDINTMVVFMSPSVPGSLMWWVELWEVEPRRLSHPSWSSVSLGLTEMTEAPLTTVSLGDHSRKEVEGLSPSTLTTLRKDTYLAAEWRDDDAEISMRLPFPFVLQDTA